jgi:hypothetical protein
MSPISAYNCIFPLGTLAASDVEKKTGLLKYARSGMCEATAIDIYFISISMVTAMRLSDDISQKRTFGNVIQPSDSSQC